MWFLAKFWPYLLVATLVTGGYVMWTNMEATIASQREELVQQSFVIKSEKD